MRFARRSSLLLILLSALLAGCGGNQIAADEVPVDPPVLTIPSDPDAAPGATTAGTDDADKTDQDADADATPTAEPGTSGSTSSGGTTSSGSTGGTAATPAPTAAATATAAPEDTGGATADEGLDQFCADNPGAC